MKTLLLVVLVISLSFAIEYHDPEEEKCSYGDMDYLCENFETCEKFGFIDLNIYNVLCVDDDFSFPTTEPYYIVTKEATPTEDQEVVSSEPTEAGFTTYYMTTDNGVVTEGERTEEYLTNRYSTGYTFPPSEEPSEEEGSEEEEVYDLPPVIVQAPRNITVRPGNTGTFECSAKAGVTPQITITKQDQLSRPELGHFRDAAPGFKIQTTTNAFRISNVAKTNEGWYTCLACNNYGCDEQDAYLHVLDLCEGVTCPGEQLCVGNYEEGHGHTCECPKYCETADLWVEDWVCSNYCEDLFNECHMKNDACQSNKVGIEVLNQGRCGRMQPPMIFEEADHYGLMVFTEGEELDISCHASGFPEPEVEWYRGDVMVGYGNQLKTKLTLQSSGDYTCRAVNCMTKTVEKRMIAVIVEALPTEKPTTEAAPTTVFVEITTEKPTTAEITTEKPTTAEITTEKPTTAEITTEKPTTAEITTEPTPTPTPQLDNIILDAPRSTCNVFGDPHFITYDQRPFTYMGTCDNVLAMDCYSGQWFVYGRMRPCGRGSCLESVTVIVDGMVLELQRGWLVNKNAKKIVTKNRRNRVISFTEGETTINLKFNGKILELTAVLPKLWGSSDNAQDKLVVQWDGFMSVQIQTPLTTRTCGLCGDNDGNPDNDFRTRGRYSYITADPDVFGASWELGTCNEQAARRTSEEMCGDQFKKVKAECEAIFSIPSFMECKEAGHDATNWVDSCIYDQCATDLQKEALPPKCMVAAAYATRCESTFWDVNSSDPQSARSLDKWELEAGCPAMEERFQPILDTGCPQATLQEEIESGSINEY